jgi:hypothetical protein
MLLLLPPRVAPLLHNTQLTKHPPFGSHPLHGMHPQQAAKTAAASAAPSLALLLPHNALQALHLSCNDACEHSRRVVLLYVAACSCAFCCCFIGVPASMIYMSRTTVITCIIAMLNAHAQQLCHLADTQDPALPETHT